MFVEISGHLINADHIVEVTPQNHVSLSNGSNVTATTEEVTGLHDMLAARYDVRRLFQPQNYGESASVGGILAGGAALQQSPDTMDHGADLLANAAFQIPEDATAHHEDIVLEGAKEDEEKLPDTAQG